MSNNSDILNKYSSTPFSQISLDEIKEDFMKLKPIYIPLYDIFTLNTLGTYINKFSAYVEWKHYENIDTMIIEMLRKEYQTLQINYEEITIQIKNSKENLEAIYKVEFKILDILDKQYKSQYKINENFNQNTVIETMLYLEFRQNISSSMKQILEKYKADVYEIEEIEEFKDNLIEMIYENFKQLESDEDFMISIKFIESVKDKINKKIENTIKEMFQFNKFDLNKFDLNEFNQEEVRDRFYCKLDKIYRDTIEKEFNLFNQEFLDKIEQVFDVDKEINKISFTCEYITQILQKV